MTNKLTLKALAALIAVPMVTATPAVAQSSGYGYDGRHGGYDQQAYAQNVAYHRDDRVYRGRDRHYRRKCGGGNGAVGTVAGGAGGALLGNALGGGTLGTVAGGVGGALLGRHLDKKNTRSRNGC